MAMENIQERDLRQEAYNTDGLIFCRYGLLRSQSSSSQGESDVIHLGDNVPVVLGEQTAHSGGKLSAKQKRLETFEPPHDKTIKMNCIQRRLRSDWASAVRSVGS